MNKKKNTHIICSNCGKSGHGHKYCTEPVVSLGIILIKLNPIYNNDIIWNTTDKIKISDLNDSMGIKINNDVDIKLYVELKQEIKFLMIRRKHTVGYVEFIRGRYILEKLDGISSLFQQMTNDEIKNIGISEFDDLWNEFWCIKEGHNYHNLDDEYKSSKDKFNKLKNGISGITLSFFVNYIKPAWDQYEWEFPKGRRNKNEKDIECAKREFEEETGLKSTDYKILESSIEPLVDDFYGTNGVKYKYIYYVALSTSDKIPVIDNTNEIQKKEIGDIDYLHFDDILKSIRPHHISRKSVISKLFNFIINKIIEYIKEKKL